jgi:hypothetical protein
MRNFLATVLSVIAAGVLLIAYGLLTPRMAADAYPRAQPRFADERAGDIEDLTLRRPAAYAVSDFRAMSPYDDRVQVEYRPSVRRVAERRVTSRQAPRVVRSSRRDWAKTAMVIGGTAAAGAGLGAIFGGKKGALIGAAIGGGAGTLFEVKR